MSAIAYRIGDYAAFRDSLLSGLSEDEFAALRALQTRDADDFTIALLDGVACAADVLTFYQERIANESYLGTATERVSLQEMARLLGYRLRPGVAAETWLAFALEPPKVAPPELTSEPGAFVTGIPAAIDLPSGLQVKSVPGPGETSQTFETIESVAARAEWNAARPWQSEARSPRRGDTSVHLQGVRHNIKIGDAAVFVMPGFFESPTTNTDWELRFVAAVEIDPANDRTRLAWKRGLELLPADPVTSPHVYVLRRRAAIFGNNAPLWRSMSLQFRIDYSGDDDPSDIPEWPGFTTSELEPTPTGGHVDLDAVYGEIATASVCVLAKGEVNRPGGGDAADARVSLYRIDSTSDVSRAAFALSAKITRLGLSGPPLADGFRSPAAVRQTSIYVQGERLPLASAPVTDQIDGDAVPVTLAPEGLTPGRRIIIKGRGIKSGTEIAHAATIAGVDVAAPGTVLRITPRLVEPLRRDTVVVHANVALATHGETVSQILGSGDASQPGQRFTLARLPLTYRSAATELGADSDLTIRAGNVEWTEHRTLFGRGPTDRGYVLESDPDGSTTVVFGDGVRGARLPTGVGNVRATYRQGLGAAGNVKPDTLTQLVSRPLGLKGVSNPVPARGGADPESAADARRTIPFGVRTLGRVVSVLDYEDFALAFSGIAKAQAKVVQLPAGRTIAIAIAGPDGAEMPADSPTLQHLARALRENGDPHVNLVLLSYQPVTFRLGLKVKRDPVYALEPLLAEVEAALRARYSFARQDLGEPVFQSEVLAVAHAVPGVVAIDLDFLYGGTSPVAQTKQSLQTRLLATRLHVAGQVPRAAELLTLHPDRLDRLEELR